MKGFDAAGPVGALAARLKAAGIGFVGRYYSYNPAKNLTPGEARAIAAAGLKIVSVWEARGDVPGNFTAAQGGKDAAEALILAAGCGQPAGSAIYFAVDYDAGAAQIAGGVAAYFAAVGRALDGRYAVGCYGSGAVCTFLRANQLARYCWLAGAAGWFGSRDFTGWHIRQELLGMGDPAAAAGDLDGAVDREFGAWSPATPPARSVTPGPAIPAARELQTALAAAGLYPPGDIDGEWGPRSQAALAAYYRS